MTDDEGRLSLTLLETVDLEFAAAIRKGRRVQPLRAEVRRHFDSMRALSGSGNLTCVMAETEMQLLELVRERVVGPNKRELRDALDLTLLEGEIVAEMPQWTEVVPDAIAFIRAYGAAESPFIPELVATYDEYVVGTDRRLDPKILAATAKLERGHGHTACSFLKLAWLNSARAGVCVAATDRDVGKLMGPK